VIVNVDTASKGVVEQEHAADVLAYFSHPEYGTYAAVRWYQLLRGNANICCCYGGPVTPYPAVDNFAYGVVPIEAIDGHARLAQGFEKVDALGIRYIEFFWEKVCNSVVRLPVSGVRRAYAVPPHV
jgi:hypothetical protein